MKQHSHFGSPSNKISLFTSSYWANIRSSECGFYISLNSLLDLLMRAQILQHHLLYKVWFHILDLEWDNVIVKGNGSYSACTKEKRDGNLETLESVKKKKEIGGWYSEMYTEMANPVMWGQRSCTPTECSPFIWFSFSVFRHLQVNYQI